MSRERGDHRQVLGLDEGHSALAAGAGIAIPTSPWPATAGIGNFRHRRIALAAQSDPFDPALPGQDGHQDAEREIGRRKRLRLQIEANVNMRP